MTTSDWFHSVLLQGEQGGVGGVGFTAGFKGRSTCWSDLFSLRAIGQKTIYCYNTSGLC